MNTALQKNRINRALYELHRNLSQPLSASQLAACANYSEQHFHRIFRQVTGESVNAYSRRIRLEAAANQLMFTPQRAVIEIAQKCGFQSLASFGHAFKQQFGCSPGQWRTQRIAQQTPAYLADKEIAAAFARLKHVEVAEPEYIELPDIHVAYIRHQGYGRHIKRSWQLLRAWAKHAGHPFEQQYGLHHSNPVQTPLQHCRYVACLAVAGPVERHSAINTLSIPGGLHAKFDFSGRYGELLPLITKVQQQWLTQTQLSAKTTPAFVHYRKNHFLAADECFELSFYLPLEF
ncbi:MAG: AraC family transcriptional regulator [Pseudomonadales bacterium]